jgi:hypothetical protein
MDVAFSGMTLSLRTTLMPATAFRPMSADESRTTASARSKENGECTGSGCRRDGTGS